MSSPARLTRLPALSQRFLLRRQAACLSTSAPRSSRLRQPGEPTGPNEPPSHISAPPSKSPLKVWPILLILATGSFFFKQIVDQRKGEAQGKGPGSGIPNAGQSGHASVGQTPSGRTVKPSFPH